MLDQAIEIYQEFCAECDLTFQQPSIYDSEINGNIVTLQNCNGLLAIVDLDAGMVVEDEESLDEDPGRAREYNGSRLASGNNAKSRLSATYTKLTLKTLTVATLTVRVLFAQG